MYKKSAPVFCLLHKAYDIYGFGRLLGYITLNNGLICFMTGYILCKHNLCSLENKHDRTHLKLNSRQTAKCTYIGTALPAKRFVILFIQS